MRQVQQDQLSLRAKLETHFSVAFLLGWGLLALFCGFIWGEVYLAFKAPLFGILPLFYIGSVGFWISLVITLGLLISIVMSLIKLQWKK